MRYTEAAKILGSRDHKKVANNTYLHRTGPGTIALRLHNTNVLTFGDTGITVYNTGGWRTSTTKQRFNRFGPDGVRVYSDKGAWTVYREGEIVEEYRDGFTWYDDDAPVETIADLASVPMTPFRAVALAEGFEDGTDEERIEAWQYLIDTGMAWTLQGSFGRTAMNLIEQGICTR